MTQQFPTRGGLCFYIRKSKTDNPVNVYATFYYRGVKHHASLGIKVRPSQWDKINHRAKVSTTYSENDNLNNRIANAKLKSIEFGFLDKNLYLCNKHLEIIDTITKFKTKKSKMTKIKNSSSNTIKTNGVIQLMRNSAMESVHGRSYETELSKINRFSRFLKASKLSDSFDSMTYENIDKFNKWLNSSKTKLSLDTASQTLRAVKKYLKRFGDMPVYDFNYNASGINGIKPPKDTRTTEEIHNNYIALTHKQIEQIANLEIRNDNFLATCRELFLMQCYSGVRVSDMRQLLNPEKFKEIDGEPFVVFVPKKTNKTKFKEANIPLNALYPQLASLYDKHKGKSYDFLPTSEDEKGDKRYNEAIKKLGLMCGWHDEIQVVKLIGGKKQTIKTEFYKVLTNHCGRHSLVTNAVREFNMSFDDVIKITGHHDTQQITSRYLNLKSGEDAALLNKSLKEKGLGAKRPKKDKSAKGDMANFGIADEKEALKVLKFLGVDTSEMADRSFSDLVSEIGQHQGELYDDYGVTFEIMKPLFNAQTPLAKRKKLLKVVCETMAE